jgi:hypothetical protein
MLTSQVTGGTPPYTFQWTPASLVLAPTMWVTPTQNLYASQNFTMQVTDSKGCISTGQTLVTIEGGPLAVNPVAVDPVICRNESTTLRAVPGGGSNTYESYSWTSNPPGFTSSLAEPEVSPTQTTDYTVVVFDGYNYSPEGTVRVEVNQLPAIDLIPYNPKVQVISNNPAEIGVCVFDTVTIDAGNPGSEYLWSNGATTQSLDVLSSGISFDLRQYSVTVQNPATGCVNNSNITIYFTFSNCSYGIPELENDSRLQVYPNPSADGIFQYSISGLYGEMLLEIFTADGRKISEEKFEIVPGSERKSLININKAPGLYLMKLSSREAILLKRLIHQK